MFGETNASLIVTFFQRRKHRYLCSQNIFHINSVNITLDHITSKRQVLSHTSFQNI